MSVGKIVVARVDSDADLKACFEIRNRVFVKEQGVTEREEYDGLDPECTHYLLTLDGKPMATLRIRNLDDAVKVQRVAVLAEGRGAGLGAALMRHMLAEMRAAGAEKAVLGSQVSAIPFYERIGFISHGPEYMDAGIPHRDMTLTF